MIGKDGPGSQVAVLPDDLYRKLSIGLTATTVGIVAFWIVRGLGQHAFDGHEFVLAFGIGAAAQFVYGSIGMAYGVIANSLLLTTGLTPAAATATVHMAEAFTTAATGLSHWRLGNVDRRMFWSMAITGVIGGVIGAVLVTHLNSALLRPLIAAYLLILGVVILFKALRPPAPHGVASRKIAPVALFAGFVDSVGGGGWGLVMTSTLLGTGHDPRLSVGSVNASRFIVSLASSSAFVVLMGIQRIENVAGLMLGGLIVAPYAARLTQFIPRKTMMLIAGLIIIGLSILTIVKSTGFRF